MTSQPKPGEVLNGEWIEWTGGENPAPDQAVEVKIRWRKGEPSEGSTMSDNLEWRHVRRGHGDGGDIIAYRIVRPLEPSGGQDGGGPAGYFQHNETWNSWEQVAQEFAGQEGVIPLYRQALASPAKVTGWQGIETVPIGVPVLAYWPKMALDDDGEQTGEVLTSYGHISLTIRHSASHGWEPDNVIEANGDWFGDDFEFGQPSHWMLPPEAPTNPIKAEDHE